MITIDDFAKLEIKIGTILSVEKIPNADKLLKLIVDLGSEKRQILSGIALHYSDYETLVGKQVTVLTNLEYRTMRGEESQGMILMAEDENGKPILLSPLTQVPSGAVVK